MSYQGVLAANSKSFALAARLLPRGMAEDAAVVYAFCRRADDAIDRAPLREQPAALQALRAQVDAAWSHAAPADALLSALQEVARRRQMPRAYFDELLDGMEMDVRGQDYATLDELLGYCHRVAGTVGLMMCHVLGVRSAKALRHAAHLGIAMQLTNICRDVVEDFALGRLYLPRAGFKGAVLPGGQFPERLQFPAKLAVRALLAEARRYYASADEGLRLLGWRPALAIRTARLVYAAIGDRLEAIDCDVLAGRAVVPLWRKLWLAARAFAAGLLELPRRLPALHVPHQIPEVVLRFPDDVLPL